MKWLDDPPEDWETAPEEPPASRERFAVIQAEMLINGIVVREPDSAEAYIYTSDDGALAVSECA